MIFIVRTEGEQPNEPGIRVVLTRHGHNHLDLYCTGDEDACARLQAGDWTVIRCHDGWYPDDHDGGIAVWGGGRHWELRDTPLHVKEQGD